MYSETPPDNTTGSSVKDIIFTQYENEPAPDSNTEGAVAKELVPLKEAAFPETPFTDAILFIDARVFLLPELSVPSPLGSSKVYHAKRLVIGTDNAPAAILFAVTADAASLAVTIDPAAILTEVIANAAIAADVMAETPIFEAIIDPAAIFIAVMAEV